MQGMWHHFELLIEANRSVNLTSITDATQAAGKHYSDSLAVAAWCDSIGWQPTAVLDVGTGGGFPALPLAIQCPDWQITAIDGTGKKVRCVEHFVDELGLPNCRVLQCRAEHWSTDTARTEGKSPTQFDLVLFRAIGSMGKCLTLARNLCRHQGVFVCYKTDPLSEAERNRAREVADKLAFAELARWPYAITCGPEKIRHQLCCYKAV